MGIFIANFQNSRLLFIIWNVSEKAKAKIKHARQRELKEGRQSGEDKKKKERSNFLGQLWNVDDWNVWKNFHCTHLKESVVCAARKERTSITHSPNAPTNYKSSPLLHTCGVIIENFSCNNSLASMEKQYHDLVHSKVSDKIDKRVPLTHL